MCRISTIGIQSRYLQSIINDPSRRQNNQRTDHDNPSADTLGRQGSNSNFTGNGSDGLALVLRLTKQRDERVSRVRDDSADDASQVARRECDAKLRGLGITRFLLGEDVGIEKRYDLFEEKELGHGIWDLYVSLH
jgi:hypothetical protein